MNQYSEKKLVVFDLDETLTESKMQVQDPVRLALESLLEKKKVGIISGGTLKRISFQVADHISSEHMPNLYLLPGNGSSLYEYDAEKKKWMLQYQECLEDADKKSIENAYSEAASDLSFKKPDHLYGNLIEDKGGQITFSELGIDAPLDVKQGYDPDQAKRQEIAKKLSALLPKFSVQIGGLSSIDVTPKYINKAYGMSKLIEFLHFKKEDALFIGDAIYPGGNDYTPQEAGYDCIKTKNPDQTAEIIKKILE